jgi:hypothetical protein
MTPDQQLPLLTTSWLGNHQLMTIDPEAAMQSLRAAPGFAPEGGSAATAWAALQRSGQHLNGIPCFVFQAYRSVDAKLAPPSVLWVQVAAQCAAKRSDGVQQSLFDPLVVGSR